MEDSDVTGNADAAWPSLPLPIDADGIPTPPLSPSPVATGPALPLLLLSLAVTSLICGLAESSLTLCLAGPLSLSPLNLSHPR